MTEYIRTYIRTCEGYGWEGGPSFSTRIVQKANGRERRNADWANAHYFFSLPFNNITQPQYVPILEMYLNRMGAWGCFLFRNPLDWWAQDAIFATAEPGQTEFQLGKMCIKDGVSFFRKIYALYLPDDSNPENAAESDIEVTANGSPVSVTVDPDRGVIVTDSPMSGGEVMRWTGGFSHWVRFNSDKLPFSIDNKSGEDYVVNGTVDLMEIHAPEDLSSSS